MTTDSKSPANRFGHSLSVSDTQTAIDTVAAWVNPVTEYGVFSVIRLDSIHVRVEIGDSFGSVSFYLVLVFEWENR